MKLYNSMTNKIEEFIPLHEGKVNMYVCGPTVYNHAHIGNARPIIVFDTLRRVFEATGYEVKFVSNFTDVDDKIINKAKEEGLAESVISNRYIEAYQAVRQSLNTLGLTSVPKVTETMDEIIEFIEKLVELEYAYVVDGDVYFRVDKIKAYGQLSKQNLEDLQAGARIESNHKKENPFDFALWKTTETGIKWNTPWGEGRPGWHTECVVMIDKEFNHEMIDIHAGGMDLKFPHHENEIAQSEAVFHHPIAKYWLHNGMLNIDGEKMSKSLGNVLWAKDVIERLGSDITRWLMLSVLYRAPLNISEEAIEQAKAELNKVYLSLNQASIKAQLLCMQLGVVEDIETMKPFIDAMEDDLNTPNAYKEIFEVVKKLNQALRQRELDWVNIQKYYGSLIKMLEILGIIYIGKVLSDSDFEMFENWNAAKAEKNFDKADEYRAILAERGLV